MHELHHEGVWAGLSRFTDGGDEVVKWILEERELRWLSRVLPRSRSREPKLEVKEGDLFSIPEGASTKWHQAARPFLATTLRVSGSTRS
jgi:hypothetical protein